MERTLADSEVEQNRPGHDGNMLAAEGVADLLTREVAPHAGRRFESEGTAARQQDSVHLIGDMARTQGVHFLRAASAAPDIDASHGAAVAQDRGAPGDRLEIGNVAGADSRDVGKSFHR